MIRFAWLQARTQTLVAFGGLVIVAIVVGVTGPHLVHLYDAILATCAAHGDCSTAADSILPNERNLWLWMGIVMLVTPGLIGLFWGAPLIARELEAGTYRLAWTQSVTRGPVARGQACGRGPGRHGGRRAPKPLDHVVGEPDRHSQRESVRGAVL